MSADEFRLECLRLLMEHTGGSPACIDLVKNAKILSNFVINGTTESKET